MIKKIRVDKALTWEDPPDGTHRPVIDPYEGCTIRCPFCYLLNDKKWAKDVLVKVNMPDIIKRDLTDWSKNQPIHIGSRCDPYMPIEKTYGLTRECLISLNELRVPSFLSTKGDPELISRDLDVMKTYQTFFMVVLGLVNLRQLVNSESSDKTENIKFAMCLHELGINVTVHIMPVLPEITDVRLMLDALPPDVDVWLYKLQSSLITQNGRMMLNFIKKHFPDLTGLYGDLGNGSEDIYYQQLKDDLKDDPRVIFPYK